MKNWLIIQSDGEHKGQDGWVPNWYLRECYAIAHALNINGHCATVWGLRHDNYATVPDFESYDAILVLENYETDWLPDLTAIHKPLKLQWIIDLHVRGPEAYSSISKGCDVILHSTRELMAGYRPHAPHAKHIWFPNGVDSRYFTQTGYGFFNRSRDLVFVGSLATERKAVIEYLVNCAGLEHYYGPQFTGAAYIKMLLATKIHFNMPIAGDLNYRNFETLGLGACLLTKRLPCMEELGFKHGVNCLLYDTVDEAVKMATFVLEDPQALACIGYRGYQFSKKHSYIQRISDLLPQLIWKTAPCSVCATPAAGPNTSSP